LPDAQQGEGQRVFCSGLGEETRAECSEGFGDCGLAYDEVSRVRADCDEELVAAEEGFAEADAVQIYARVKLAAAGVEEGIDAGGSRRLGEMVKNGEAGDCDQREIERVAQPLGGTEADADPGEGAGAVDYGDGFERFEAKSGAGREVADGRDEALGGGATRKAGAGDAHGVGQGDAAGGAASVDDEDLHAGDFRGIRVLNQTIKYVF
jgi:hypothetical protein